VCVTELLLNFRTDFDEVLCVRFSGLDSQLDSVGVTRKGVQTVFLISATDILFVAIGYRRNN